jgi:hypothetical protein
MRHAAACLAIAMLMPAPAIADTGHGHEAPYAGQQKREIKSLSAQDVDDLLAGRGWGLAKAAELNGLPGPAHLLELKDELGLTADQVRQIESLFADMNRRARELGRRLVDLEKRLDQGFAQRRFDDAALQAALRDIAGVRGELRYVHLATHLKTPPILTKSQIAAYNRLRGYAGDDPCAAPPVGHDAAMWRKHHGCQ